MTSPSIFQIIIYLFPESLNVAEDVETSSATKSEEKRMFSQATLNAEKIKLTHVQYYLT